MEDKEYELLNEMVVKVNEARTYIEYQVLLLLFGYLNFFILFFGPKILMPCIG